MPDPNSLVAAANPRVPKKTGFAEQASGLIDSAFAPVGKPLGQVARGLVEPIVGQVAPQQKETWGKAAQGFGENLPRLATQIALTSRGGAAKALGLGDVGLQSFAHTDTQQSLGRRLAAAGTQAAAFEVAPKVGEFTGGVAKSIIPDAVNPLLATAAKRGSSLVGTLSAFEAANAASAAIQKQDYNPFTPEHIAGVATSVLPFEALGAFGDAKAMMAGPGGENGSYQNLSRKAMPLNAPLDELSDTLSRQKEAIKTLNTRQETEHKEQVAPVPQQQPGDFERFKELQGIFKSHMDKMKEGFGMGDMDAVSKADADRQVTQKEMEEIKNRNQGMPPVEPKVEKPAAMGAEEMSLVDSLSNLGHDPKALTEVIDRLSKLKNHFGALKVADLAARALDIDPKVNLPNDPDTLLRSAKSTVEFMTREVLGMPEESVKAWTRRFLTFVNLAGKSQGATRILPAIPFREGEQIKAASFYAPSRGDVPNAFMGILTSPYGSKDRSMFEFFHSTAHELFHGALYQAEGKTYHGKLDDQMVQSAQNLLHAANEMNLSQVEMEQAIKGTLKSMASSAHSGMLDFRSQFYTPTPGGRTEFLADMYGLLAMGAMDKDTSRPYQTVDDYLKFGSDDFRNFAKGMLRDIGSVWHVMTNFLKQQFGWKGDAIQTVEDIVKNMKGLMKPLDQAEKSTELFLRQNEIRNATPFAPVAGVSYDRIEQLFRALGAEPYDPEIKALAKEVSPLVVPQSDKKLPKELGVHLSFIDYFKAIPQIVRDIPQWADMGRLARAYQGIVKEAAMDMWSQMKHFETGRYDVAGMVRLMQPNTPLNKAFNTITLRQNELKGDEFGRRLTPDELKKMPEYAKLSPEDRTFLDEKLNQVSSASMVGARHLVESQYKKMSNRVARAWMTQDARLKWDEAKDLGEALVSQYADIDRLQGGSTDKDLAARVEKGKNVLEAYAERNPQALQKMMEIFTTDKNGDPLEEGKNSDVVESFRKYREQLKGKWLPPDKDTPEWHFEGRPGYTSEVRPGDFLLMWKKKGEEPQLVGVKTRKAYNEQFKKLADEYNSELSQPEESRKFEYFKGVDKSTERDRFSGLRPDLFKTYNDAITALNNRVLAKVRREHPGSDELIGELYDELKPAAEIAKLMEAPWMKERKLYGGREKLNMAEGMAHYINSVAYTVAKRELKDQQQLYLQDPKMRSQPELQSLARRYFNEILDPTEKGYTPIKMLAAFNYIFFSPSLALVELTQQLTNHIPALLSAGMGVGDAYKSVKDANIEMFNAALKGKNDKAGKNVYEDPEITDAVHRAKQNGIIDAGWLQEFFHLEDDLPFINSRNVFAGEGNVFDKQGLIGQPLYHLYRLGVNAHSLAINVNTEVAFVSAYKHFRKTNDAESAFKLADDLSHESMHGGGRASRPLWFLGIGPGSPGSTVGGLMYLLQMYTYNTIGQQTRYLRQAIANSKLNPNELTAAHKAAGIAIGTQIALAGVMGIPFASQIVALIEQMFPNTEPKRKMREMFFGAGKWLNSKTHIFGQDRQMGSFLADAGMSGVVNSIDGGVNIGNRFELGGLLGVDPYRGFSWKNVVGPTGSLFEDMLTKPAGRLAEGDYAGAAREMIPNSNIRRLAKLAADGWNVRNQDQRLNVDLSQSEKTLMALGLTPKRVADFRELNEMKKRAEKVHSAEAKSFHERMATLAISGNLEQVKKELFLRARQEENYDPREGARRVAELVQQRTEPFDPERTGSRTGGTYKSTETFDSPPVAQPSESQLLLQRLALSSELGFPQKLTKVEMRQAQLVDRLLQMYPTMSRLEAKAMVEKQLHPRLQSYQGANP